MPALTLAQSQTITTEALRQGRALGLKPLTVAVLDAGGHPIALVREDGASTLRPAIAIGKASGALALGVSSRKIAEMAADRPTFVGSLAGISPGGIIPAAGGVIIVDAGGAPIGAVGVTGDTSDNDEIAALAGIEAANLTAQG
ncbi:MAG: heme-binding protein [Novosphingobium sp.]